MSPTVEESRASIADLIQARVTLTDSDAAAERRLAGDVSSNVVRLRVDRRPTRKSWNVEFEGVLEPVASGSRLDGAISILDWASLQWFVRLARIAALVPLALVLAMAAFRSEPVGVPSLSIALVVVFAGTLGTFWLERLGERAAVEDADALAMLLTEQLEPALHRRVP